jgi:hypothetical protein
MGSVWRNHRDCGPREAPALLAAQPTRTGRTIGDIATQLVDDAGRSATAGGLVDVSGETSACDEPSFAHDPLA